MTDDFALATLLAAPHGVEGSVTAPIVQSSLFTFSSYQDFADRMSGQSSAPIYSRVQNPTVAAFEAMMAQAERGEAAIGFASGMGAISSTLWPMSNPAAGLPVSSMSTRIPSA